jgi:hypothetical protein
VFHRCYSARPVPLTTLVKAAGRRWTAEETFQAAKGLAGLDEHQARRWTSWHRWTTPAMLAHAFLAVTAAIERAGTTPPPELAPLTCSEIRLTAVRAVTDELAQAVGELFPQRSDAEIILSFPGLGTSSGPVRWPRSETTAPGSPTPVV